MQIVPHTRIRVAWFRFYFVRMKCCIEANLNIAVVMAIHKSFVHDWAWQHISASFNLSDFNTHARMINLLYIFSALLALHSHLFGLKKYHFTVRQETVSKSEEQNNLLENYDIIGVACPCYSDKQDFKVTSLLLICFSKNCEVFSVPFNCWLFNDKCSFWMAIFPSHEWLKEHYMPVRLRLAFQPISWGSSKDRGQIAAVFPEGWDGWRRRRRFAATTATWG